MNSASASSLSQSLNKSSSSLKSPNINNNNNNISSTMKETTNHYHSLADQTLAGSTASELLAHQLQQHQQNEIMSDDEYKLFMLEMKDLHHTILKDVNTIGDERDSASEEWWNSLALNKSGPSASLFSSPQSSSPSVLLNNNNITSNSNNSNNNSLQLNLKLINTLNNNQDEKDFSPSNLNNSNDSINSLKRDQDDSDDSEEDDELSTSSSLAQFRKLIPRIPNLIPPDEPHEKSPLNMFNLTSPKKPSNQRVSNESVESLLKSPKQQLETKRNLSIFLDGDESPDFNVFSLTNSPSTSSKRNFENTFETLSKAFSPSKQNGIETVTIPKKEYEDLKTENVILQGRLIQMELIHEKLLSMILKNKSNN